MAVFIDALSNEPESALRLWDSQTGSYATDRIDLATAVRTLRSMMASGGIRENPDTAIVLALWLEQARKRGTNDPSKKAVDANGRAWRPSNVTAAPGPLRHAIRSAALAAQVAQGILDLRVSEWMDRLSPAAQALVDRNFVIQELLRGPGVATLRVPRDPPGIEHDFRSLIRDPAIIAEFAAEWSDAVTVKETGPPDSAEIVLVFRLR